jgi:hypothetical protein
MQTLNAYAKGLDRGTEFQQRLMRDDYKRGIVDAHRQICSETGGAVPAWVETLASEIEQRRAVMRSETEPTVRPVVGAGADVVH